jgi:carbon-monoxide dehydrogenase large subunit
MVLLEDFHYDARGNPTTATYKDYLLPAISDIPDFEYVHANTPAKNEGGFRGVGEGGAIIGPPTLFNAIADALSPFGEVPLILPLTPSRLLDVIDGVAVPEAASPAPTEDSAAPEPTSETPGISAALAGVDPEEIVPAGSATVEGRWNMVMKPPMGPEQQMVATFHVDDGVLTGKLDAPEGAQEFIGTADGNRLKWEMKITQPISMTLKYDVTIDGDALSGKCKLGIMGSAKVAGSRA